MTVYIDFISTLKILGSIAIFTGGTNYAKYITSALNSHCKGKIPIKLLLPENASISDSIDVGPLEQVKVKNLLEVNYEEGDILFLPQVNGSLLVKLPKIRKKYPFLKIYGTLHDRQHNIIKYDSLDYTFDESLKKKYKLFSFIYYLVKKKCFNLVYDKNVKALDKVFTVSNYSMQLLDSPNIAFIKYYIQGCYTTISYPINNGNYILFVGGNRGEKNLIRGLLAFRKFKKMQKSSLQLKVTGISEKLKSKISRIINLEDDIILMPYVSDEELSLLYSNCRYVAFLSRAEGYGCPVREALQYGKVVLASRTTSVPEVAGAAIYYINPYSVDSITSGMVYLSNDQNLKRYQEYINERKIILDRIAQQDLKIFIDDFFD